MPQLSRNILCHRPPCTHDESCYLELLVPDSLCVMITASNDRFELNVALLSLCDRCVNCKFTASIVDCDLGGLKSLVVTVTTTELDILDGLVSIICLIQGEFHLRHITMITMSSVKGHGPEMLLAEQ